MSDVLLAEKWSEEDPTGWWVSEKLDGVRAVWRGGEFVSRGDNKFACPEWFRKKIPAGCVLDGELWAGRRQFQKTVGIVKSGSRAKEWEFVTYMVFDVLADESGTSVERQPFEERLETIRRICGDSEVMKAVPMHKCSGRDHLQELLLAVEGSGGEGLMLRRPRSVYEHRRSKSLLKVKTFHDEEAIVVGHDGGVGRNTGVCGALVCETPDKRRFKVGSGLSDAQRRDPPKVGSVITYRYQELTNANIPRFPTLAGERLDLDWRAICATYVPPSKRLEAALKKKHTVLFGEDVAATGSRSMPAPVMAAASSAAPTSKVPLRGIKRGLSNEDMQQRGAPEQDLEDLFGDAATSVREPAAKLRKVDKRPLCPYGLKCYRSNPAHFLEFAHPWLDEENGEPLPGAPESAPPAPAVMASSASSGRAEIPASTDAGSAAAVATSPVQHAAVETARISTPSPQRPSTALASASGAPHADAASPGRSSPEDVRILALRNLLASLVRDAAPGAEHDHFAQLLALLIAGPAGSAAGEGEELPPLPPPDDPPSAVHIGRPEETQLIEPVDVAASNAEPALPAGVDKADFETLTGMGFPTVDATEALLLCGTLDRAVEHLLAKSPR